MKVLHVLRSNHFSGAENVACQIIEMFNDDQSIEYAYSSENGQIKDELERKGIKFFPMKKLCLQELRRVVNEYKPDIIHAHDIKASTIAAVFSNKIKIISHIHGNHEDMRKITLKSLLFRLASSRINNIIWVSDSAFTNYHFKTGISNKSEVLYNILDVQKLLDRTNQDTQIYDFDIVYLGRLTYAKNPTKLMTVLKLVLDKLPQVKVAIIGDGELEIKTKEYANKIGILEKIKFLGFMDNPLKILKDAKVMLMTSIYEGTPMCVLEALSLGIPLVSTPTDGIKEIVCEGKTGFLSDEDEILARQVISLLSDEQSRLEMSKVCVESAKHINNIANYKSTIKRVYYG